MNSVDGLSCLSNHAKCQNRRQAFDILCFFNHAGIRKITNQTPYFYVVTFANDDWMIALLTQFAQRLMGLANQRTCAVNDLVASVLPSCYCLIRSSMGS